MTLRTCATAMLTLAMVYALAPAAEDATKPSGAAANAAAAATAPATSPATTTSAPATQPEEEEIDLPPYYMVLVKEVDMPEAQQKTLAAEVKKRTAAVEAWIKEHGDERKSLQTELVIAYKERDKENIALLKGKLAELNAQQRTLEKKLDAQVESVLTEKQRTAWEGYLLYDKVMGPFWDLKLDDDQKTRARNICLRSVASLMKVQTNKAEADKIYDELYKSIRERVLTQEQRDKLDKKPATAPATAPAKPA